MGTVPFHLSFHPSPRFPFCRGHRRSSITDELFFSLSPSLYAPHLDIRRPFAHAHCLCVPVGLMYTCPYASGSTSGLVGPFVCTVSTRASARLFWRPWSRPLGDFICDARCRPGPPCASRSGDAVSSFAAPLRCLLTSFCARAPGYGLSRPLSLSLIVSG